MAHLPKFYYLVLAGLIFMLTGCELPRDSAATDVPPVEQMPPTLAPLGADTTNNNAAVNAATAVPTVVNVQPVVAQPAQVAVVADTAVTQTAEVTNGQAIVISVTPGVNNKAAEAAATQPTTTQPTQEQPIIVDAPNSNNNAAAVNPPAAANPPVSETMGDYAAPASGNRYIVRPGDTLFGISQRFGVSVDAIVIANNMQDDIVRIGQPLIIPQGDGGYAAPAPQYNNNQPTNDNNYNGDGYHVVQAGDTLFGIARQYNVTVDSLIRLNNLMPPFVIYDGQSLAIPTGDNNYPQPRRQPQYQQPGDDQQPYPMPQQPQYQQPGADGTHTVMAGETLFSIASRYGTTAESLALANGLTNPNQIYVGQVLYLPN